MKSKKKKNPNKTKLLQSITGRVQFLPGKEVRSSSNYWLQMFTWGRELPLIASNNLAPQGEKGKHFQP